MVDSGKVTSDLASVKNGFTDYSTIVDGVGSNWTGPSYDNFISQTENFLGEFSSTISGEMDSFAEACSLYSEYEYACECLANARNNKALADKAKDAAGQSEWGGKVTQYETEKNNLKEQIEAALVAASSAKLEATSTSGTVSVSAETPKSGDSSYNGEVTQAMQSVADVASANSGGGYDNYCEAWAEIQWQNATGITRDNQASAYDAWQNFGVSTSMDNIPVGAMVYGSGHGDGNYNPYGHVGIYVGDGMVADQGGVQTMEQWLSWQTANCDGHVGYIGWGWQNGVDLTKA